MQKNTTKPTPDETRLLWDDIRYFLALASTGSLSGTARKLRVEHSTVARRVESLELALGIRLFDRLPKGWSLTPEGETLLVQAGRLEHEAQAFARAALGVSSLKGSVCVSAPPTFSSHFLVPRLAALRAQWSSIDLEVIGESRDANLARGEADIAIRMARPVAPGLVARSIGEMGYGLYSACSYGQQAEDEWEFLGYDDSLRHVPQQRWLEQIAGSRRMVFRCNDLAGLLNATRAGLGLAALPHFLAQDDPALRLVPGCACPVVRQLWLVMHPDVRRSPRVRLIADLITALIADAQALLSGAASESPGDQARSTSRAISPASRSKKRPT